MNDLISRQAAIDNLLSINEVVPKNKLIDKNDAVKMLVRLPSAQPEIKCIAKITMTDEQVKEAFEKAKCEILAAQPERKKGKWIEDAKTYYEQLNERGLRVDEYTPYFTDDIACSVCLAKYSTIDNETQFFKFCPNCGADMRGEQDEY